jgi:hypothetical protein
LLSETAALFTWNTNKSKKYQRKVKSEPLGVEKSHTILDLHTTGTLSIFYIITKCFLTLRAILKRTFMLIIYIFIEGAQNVIPLKLQDPQLTTAISY